MKPLFKHLPKLFILLFALILVNCQQQDETITEELQLIEKSDFGLKSRKVIIPPKIGQ